MSDGVIEPVQFSEWAAPIVPVGKEHKSISICNDYMIIVNQVTKVDGYPISKIRVHSFPASYLSLMTVSTLHIQVSTELLDQCYSVTGGRQ